MRIELNDDTEENTKVAYSQDIQSFLRLGKEIKISPKTNCTINKAGYKLEYTTDSVSVTIGIGDNHVGILSMTKDAWKELQVQNRINLLTTEQFKKQLYNGQEQNNIS